MGGGQQACPHRALWLIPKQTSVESEERVSTRVRVSGSFRGCLPRGIPNASPWRRLADGSRLGSEPGSTYWCPTAMGCQSRRALPAQEEKPVSGEPHVVTGAAQDLPLQPGQGPTGHSGQTGTPRQVSVLRRLPKPQGVSGLRRARASLQRHRKPRAGTRKPGAPWGQTGPRREGRADRATRSHRPQSGAPTGPWQAPRPQASRHTHLNGTQPGRTRRSS